jgi:ATP-binding cassette subfamily B multidrug efflux pump
MKKNLIDELKATWYQYRWRYSYGIVMLVIANTFLILNPILFRRAVTEAERDPQTVWKWAIILVVVAAISAIFRYLMRFTFIIISRDVERQIRSQLFERIQSQSMAFYDRHGIGELLSRLTNDITAFRELMGPGVMFPLIALTTIIPGMIALYYISPLLATATLIPFFSVPLVHLVLRKPMFNNAKAFQKLLADMSNMAQENYSAIRIIKGYVAEGYTLENFKKICKEMFDLAFRFEILQGLMFPLFVLITKCANLLLVLVSGAIILKAWSTLTTADFLSFMWLQSYIFFPILVMGWLLPIYERGRASYERLFEIYNEEIEVKDRSKESLKVSPEASIEFRHLTFTYPTGTQSVLKDIDFKIAGGKFIGITGPVGSGKSTLIKLLNREYEIPEGMIFIGERDIHEYPLDSFHHDMVTVEQVPFLFSKSIAENVLFGRREATQEELVEASQFADIHESVLEFPDKYDTLIGERGVTLSGGQKQRVAMARAFIVNRSILLLDDIFSAIDASTEKRIFEAMKKNFAGKTVVLITHRVTILEKMDQVVYISDGKILEKGSPEDLQKQNGPFAALIELQRLVK